MERITYQEIPEGMFENLRRIEDTLINSTIDRNLLEIIRLRTSQINGCAYCVDMHYKELKYAGETELRLSSLCVWEETPYYSEKERAVLHLTDILTALAPQPISDKTYAPLSYYFSKEEICFLTLAISQSNTWNRLMKVFRFTPGKYRVSV